MLTPKKFEAVVRELYELVGANARVENSRVGNDRVFTFRCTITVDDNELVSLSKTGIKSNESICTEFVLKVALKEVISDVETRVLFTERDCAAGFVVPAVEHNAIAIEATEDERKRAWAAIGALMGKIDGEKAEVAHVIPNEMSNNIVGVAQNDAAKGEEVAVALGVYTGHAPGEDDDVPVVKTPSYASRISRNRL